MKDASTKFVIIVLLLLVFGAGAFLSQSEIGREYSFWMKSVFYSKVVSKLGFLKAGVTVNLPSQEQESESEINVSEIDFENLTATVSEKKIEEAEIFSAPETDTEEILSEEEPVLEEKEISPTPKIMGLAEIGEEVDKISLETKKIEKEVKELEVLTGIQKEINKIVLMINELNKDLNNDENNDELNSKIISNESNKAV